ncbi:hypothetical protein [Streptomyces candidus]|uniref:DNA-binding protein n=1 Tax=Streptomyces candidus TaxID=67283 RepID=A0A7X0HLJ4_9ACTN|nr:hypothetical protein [Streptomyces candidus]MBB6439899.1 hypothetical protein [Streptomyces candidus]
MSLSVSTLWNYHHLGKGPQPKRYHGRLAYKISEIEAHVRGELEGADKDNHESRPAELSTAA